MRVIKNYCDHCQKELDLMQDYGGTDIEIAHHSFTTDLCQNCVEELSIEIEKFCNFKRSDNNGE